MGCLQNLLKSIVLVFAIIGFMSIGGKDFFVQKWQEFTNPPQDIMLEKAKKVGDFSHISDEFEIDKATSMLGYNGVLAEHRASGQKMIIVDSGKKPLLTPEDFQSGDIDEKVQGLTKKFKRSFISVQGLRVSDKGKIKAYGKKNQYVKFSAKVNKLPVGEVEGIISAVDIGNNESRMLISVNEKGKYSQIIAQNFFKDVNK